MGLPTLPARAAYLTIDNASRRNALSLSVLRSLRTQLLNHNTCPRTGKLMLLPPFRPSVLDELEAAHERLTSTSSRPSHDNPGSEHDWLLSSTAWRSHRSTLPRALVLRTTGPVFSSGHDLRELSTLPAPDVKQTFALCAEVMRLIRRSPTPVVCVVQNLATAAGAQLAMTCDLAIAARGTKLQLPGQGLGLPCSSPSTAVGRRAPGPGFTYRMLALAEAVAVEDLPGGAVDVVDADADKLEERVAEVLAKLVSGSAGLPQALGKWAFWTQLGIGGGEAGGSGGDGYEDAVEWTGRVMSLHAKMDDAREGMSAFLEKREVQWKT